eukprot:284807_1
MMNQLHRNEFLDTHCDIKLKRFSKYMSKDDNKNLKEQICEMYKIKQNITLTHGSEDSLYKILLYLRNNFSKLLLTDISWDYYKDLGNKINYEIDTIESTETNILEPNIDLLLQKSSKQHILILGNPCNPSGKSLAQNTIEKIIDKGTKIIMDCTYQSPDEFYRTTEKYFKYDVILITSFSKFFGLPGLRLGFFVTNDQLLHKNLDLYLGMNTEINKMINIISNNVDYYTKIRDKIKKNIDSICQLEFKNFEVYPAPSFIVIIFKDMISESIISRAAKVFLCKVKYLRKDKVIVRISVSSKNKETVLNILKSYDNFINFMKKK